jgi:ABC-type glycerol-3-phosphate transport system permease component
MDISVSMPAAKSAPSARVLLRLILRAAITALYILFLMLPIYWLVTMSFKSTNGSSADSRCGRATSRSPTTRSSSPIRP